MDSALEVQKGQCRNLSPISVESEPTAGQEVTKMFSLPLVTRSSGKDIRAESSLMLALSSAPTLIFTASGSGDAKMSEYIAPHISSTSMVPTVV
jgi:hypothetical protein